MARNLLNEVVHTEHLSEACGIHLGDEVGPLEHVPAVDHAGVCQIRFGTVKQIVKVGSTVYIWIVDKVFTNTVEIETCKRYIIAGPLFDSLYPTHCEDEPALVNTKDVNLYLAAIGQQIDKANAPKHQPHRRQPRRRSSHHKQIRHSGQRGRFHIQGSDQELHGDRSHMTRIPLLGCDSDGVRPLRAQDKA